MAGLVIDNITEYVRQKIQEAVPGADTRKGSALEDLLIKALPALIDDFTGEIVRVAQLLGVLENQEGTDLDATASKYFVTRRTGAKAEGQVRLYFYEPIDIVVPSSSKFVSSTGNNYFTVTSTAISFNQMSLNVDGDFYYMDVNVQAESPGTDYNIAAGNIVDYPDGPGSVVKVDNLSAYTNGSDAEDDDELRQRLREAITIRTLSTDNGISFILKEMYEDIISVSVFGFGTPEQQRDYLTTTTPGADVVLGYQKPIEQLGPTSGINIGGKVDAVVRTIGFTSLSNTIDSMPEYLIMRNEDEYDVLYPPYVLPTSFDYLDITRPAVRIDRVIELDAITGEEIGSSLVDNLNYLTYQATSSTGSTTAASDVYEDLNAQFITNSVPEGAVLKFATPQSYNSESVSEIAIDEILSETQVKTILPADNTASGVTYEVISSGYTIIVENELLRYSTRERMNLHITNIMAWGKPYKIVYSNVQRIVEAQNYVDTSDDRDTCADILIRYTIPAFVDLNIQYRISSAVVSLAEADVEAILTEYINGITGDTIEASDIVNVLYQNGIGYVQLPFDITVTVHNPDGTQDVIVDDSLVTISSAAAFIANNITATDIG